MNIDACMVVDGQYPADIRVRKEAEALAKEDKRVLVICPHKDNLPSEEIINDVNILRIGENYSNIKKGIYDILESVFNINFFFYKPLKNILKKHSIDVLHIHDLPLAGTGFRLKRYVNKTLILDLHENYPEAMKTWFLWKKNPLIKFKNSLFFNPRHWAKKEHKYCNKYDKVICVVEEMKEKLINNFSIPENKLVVVSNKEEKSFKENFYNGESQDIISDKVFSITYVGGFGPHRGLDVAIKAMPFILNKIPKAKLFLVGKGSVDVENKLKEIALGNNVANNVAFVGYKPFKQVSSLMSTSNINIIPHNADEHTNNTIPHKLFQIMMSNSLLLVSSCKPLKRIVEKYDAGVVFKAGDSIDLSSKIINIYNNYDNLKYKTENAFNAVIDRGENWEEERKKLVGLYNEILI